VQNTSDSGGDLKRGQYRCGSRLSAVTLRQYTVPGLSRMPGASCVSKLGAKEKGRSGGTPLSVGLFGFGLGRRHACGGANLVRLMPSTADLYSSMLGVRPRIVESTTTGVEANRDSPFLSVASATTRRRSPAQATKRLQPNSILANNVRSAIATGIPLKQRRA
jgi:hypothetical protein